MSEIERPDAVVIGSNIRGLVATYVLSSLGYRAVLIDKSKTVGGADASFTAADGSRFEFGMHVLDYMRSEAATRLFTHVVDGEACRIKLKRGIVLRNQIMPYAPDPGRMPAEFRRMLPADELIDMLGDAPPSRANLAQYYGQEYTNLVFDEVLPSFPSEARHLAFGVDESELLTNIYPWFFPRAKRMPKSDDESRTFHDQLRGGIDQYILYPRAGGFGTFSEGFLQKFDEQRIEVLLGTQDMRVEIIPGTHRVQSVSTGGRQFQAKHYFWGASWAQLCGILDIECQNTSTDQILIGSFRLNRPAVTDFHEILVGDPDHSINRIYFPAFFRESDEALMQIEFAVPRAHQHPLDSTHWRETWLANTRRLGILDDEHQVEMFDFKTRPIHFNAFGMEGERLQDADSSLIDGSSNIFPLVPSMANLNLNSHVPRTISDVISVLIGHACDGQQ